jgi:amino acid transporter
MAIAMGKSITIQEAPLQHQTTGAHLLGPLLCWAVVFADIGSSIYYVPGILYSSVGSFAGFFVLLTMGIFVLLALKYAEVSQRFPQGGGVVSVAAQSIHSWAGALGGMLILVSYFLTAAISSLSAIQYLSVVFPVLLPYILWITIGVLFLLGVLNWVGISESAKVSLIGACIAFISNLAIIGEVFSHLSPHAVIDLTITVFQSGTIATPALFVGFSGAFLAFSGLESISQLAPTMKPPRKKTIGLALLFVVISIGITSPLLTTFSTLLQPTAAGNNVLSTQLISRLGGLWGNTLLQGEVAISASLILILASNTAIIGAYHIFLALARMDFFPHVLLERNRVRGTPHYAIMLATGVPMAVLLLVQGEINILGDMYAFGLLGAFTLTCIGLDILRVRERTAKHMEKQDIREAERESQQTQTQHVDELRSDVLTLWSHINFILGLCTTFLVALAWGVSLVSKLSGVLFGGSVTLLGLAVAVAIHLRAEQRGSALVYPTGVKGPMPGSVLAVLTSNPTQTDAIIRVALYTARGKAVIFFYPGHVKITRTPRPFEIVDPYLEDGSARSAFTRAEYLARKAGIARRFVYQYDTPQAVAQLWRFACPRDTIVAAEQVPSLEEVNPDRIRYELTADGKVAHLLKRW